VPAEPELVERAPAEPRQGLRATKAERPSRPAGPAEPVVGMGDHVPLFMRRAVPNVELLAKLTDD
jgi:hypothetical protein